MLTANMPAMHGHMGYSHMARSAKLGCAPSQKGFSLQNELHWLQSLLELNNI